MTFKDRLSATKSKLGHYGREVLALNDGGSLYRTLFGLLLVVLLPVLALEIMVLLAFGVDPGILQTRSTEILNEVRPEEVPGEFRHLIPLAKKWGTGDAEEREALIKEAPLSELTDLEREVGPRMQQIADWVDGYSEKELRGSVTAGYFIFLQTAYEEVSAYLEQERQA